MDPRRNIQRPAPEQQRSIMAQAHEVMFMATKMGISTIGCSGVSFIAIGISAWIAELSELDSEATSDMLRSLAVIQDPSKSDAERAMAEANRKDAVKRIHAAADLAFAQEGGRA